MSQKLALVGKKIKADPDSLIQRLETFEGEDFGFESLQEKKKELFMYIGSLLAEEATVEEVQGKLGTWAKETGNLALESGMELDQLLRLFSVTRRSVWYIFEEEMEGSDFTPRMVLAVNKTISPVLDEAIYLITQVFMGHHKQEWEQAQATLAERSAPIVPVSDGIAVLPIIGEVDTQRAQILMETSLNHASKVEVNYLLIDVSGVPVFDTVVAHHLFQVLKALELVGVNTILTGLRPEVARSVVEMGIQFKGIHTRASVQQALMEIMLTRGD